MTSSAGHLAKLLTADLVSQGLKGVTTGTGLRDNCVVIRTDIGQQTARNIMRTARSLNRGAQVHITVTRPFAGWTVIQLDTGDGK